MRKAGSETLEGKIRRFYRVQKRMPNIREIMVLAGYRSRSSAFYAASKLVEAGVLQKDQSGKFIPGPSLHSLPKVGRIRAGFAAPAEEALADTISVGEYLIRDKEASYILEVEGDSMIDAGICPGDMVIFERTGSYKPGDIVIALIEDGYTIKYLRKRGEKYYLEAANEKYPLIYPKQGEIVGVVTGTFRKYK